MKEETTQRFCKTTLDNGLRVVSCEMPHTRSVTISVFVGVGSRYESDDEAGVSHFIEHMAFKGTRRRPNPLDISAEIEGAGGVINAATEHEITVYWCKIAQPHFEGGMDLLFDMLRNSLCRAEDVEKERHVIHEELAMMDDYPASRVDSLIDEMLWPNHPLGREIGGSRDSVNGITRAMMLDHMAEHYTPSNVVVSVAGGVSHERVAGLADELSRGWRNGAPRTEPAPVGPVQDVSQLRLEYRRTEQLHLSIALPGVALDAPMPDIYALDLLSVILGEGMSSRLFTELREKRGIAYDVHSGVSHFRDAGAFVISAGVDARSAYEAVPAILEQVADVRESVAESEVERAKRLVAGRLMLRMEDTRAVSSWMGSQEMARGEMLSVDDVVSHVNAVNEADMRRVAADLLITDRLNLAVVGPCRGKKRLAKLLRL